MDPRLRGDDDVFMRGDDDVFLRGDDGGSLRGDGDMARDNDDAIACYRMVHCIDNDSRVRCSM